MKRYITDKICKIFNFDKQNIYMLRSNHKDKKDADFRRLLNTTEFRKNSLLDYSRAYFIYQNVINLNHLKGSIAECGTYRGGMAWLIAKAVSKETPIHLFDTFEGMPNIISEHDTHRSGDLSNTSFDHVQSLMAEFDNVELHKGLFSDKFKEIDDNEQFKIVHCDADIYQSITDVNCFFYPRMVKGGVIIYDDYGWATTKGAQKAVLDFFHDKPEHPIYLPTRQAFIIKQ